MTWADAFAAVGSLFGLAAVVAAMGWAMRGGGSNYEIPRVDPRSADREPLWKVWYPPANGGKENPPNPDLPTP